MPYIPSVLETIADARNAKIKKEISLDLKNLQYHEQDNWEITHYNASQTKRNALLETKQTTS